MVAEKPCANRSACSHGSISSFSSSITAASLGQDCLTQSLLSKLPLLHGSYPSYDSIPAMNTGRQSTSPSLWTFVSAKTTAESIE